MGAHGRILLRRRGVMPDFSKGRIGESVYSLEHGEGEIAGRDGKNVLVKFVRHSAWYDYEGFPYNREADKVPILYWSKPVISDPEPPKRMKKVKGWANVYRQTRDQIAGGHYAIPDSIFHIVGLWDTESVASSHATSGRFSGTQYLEFEVPEDA